MEGARVNQVIIESARRGHEVQEERDPREGRSVLITPGEIAITYTALTRAIGAKHQSIAKGMRADPTCCPATP